MKTVLSLFFTVCLLSPVNAIRSFDPAALTPSFGETEDPDLETAFYESLVRQTDAALTALAEQTLEGTVYAIEKIHATWKESEDGNIYVEGAVAYVSHEQARYKNEIERRLNRTIGLTVTVYPLVGE